MTGSLEPSADTDRGAERLLRLTQFLTAAFTIFEQRIAADRPHRRARSARALLETASDVGRTIRVPPCRRDGA